jgi:hypothetical protein
LSYCNITNKYLEHGADHSPLTFVYVERESPDGDAHHTLTVVEELDGLRIEGEIPKMLVIEEVYGVFVELEGEGLEERDIVG